MLVLALALLGAGCGDDNDSAGSTTTTTETTSAAPAPEELVARQSDVPDGFAADPGRTGVRGVEVAIEGLTPEQVDVVRRERVAGYQATFTSPSEGVITCTAARHLTSDGAQEVADIGVDHFEASLREEGPAPTSFDVGDAVGDESWAFTFESGGVDGFLVLWRDENVLGSCTGVGAVASDPSSIVAIARAQEERISSELD